MPKELPTLGNVPSRPSREGGQNAILPDNLEQNPALALRELALCPAPVSVARPVAVSLFGDGPRSGADLTIAA
ncbi:hypothetical protein MPLB_1870020 [Mesorhizobium sp. ORS 3324]|nr:hypothetical protein MPLB_1870020 [Mesorhizobium sp. ORS 3324]